MNKLLLAMALGVAASLTSAQVNRCFEGEALEFTTPEFPGRVERFGLQLFSQLTSDARDNFFMSPYSVWSALTLAYFGAEGRTREQMEVAMNLKTKTHTYYNWGSLRQVLSQGSLKSISRAYISPDLTLRRCISNLVHDLQTLDFSQSAKAVEKINGDVYNATEGKIQDFLTFLDPRTRLVLLNAVYFKGTWEYKFPAKDTKKHEFLVHPGRSAGLVDMMALRAKLNHGEVPSLNASVLELPYANSSVSMFLLLPNDLSTHSITSNLSRDTLGEALRSLRSKNVDVFLPRFNMTTKISGELKDGLKKLGVADLFVPGRANLTAFSVSEPLNVDQVVHQAEVEVNEEGTVAAAATALFVTRMGGPEQVVNFHCNRPFVYLVHDKAVGITLFAGRYSSPPQ